MNQFWWTNWIKRESRGNSAGGNDVRRIGDVILRNFDTVTTEYYMKYVDAHNLILEKLEDALNKNARFSQVKSDFGWEVAM